MSSGFLILNRSFSFQMVSLWQEALCKYFNNCFKVPAKRDIFSYAQQMFNEEDLESEAILVRSDGETPVPLDRLQVSFMTSFTFNASLI